MVVFVLVLRTLPAKTGSDGGLDRARAWLAVAVGATGDHRRFAGRAIVRPDLRRSRMALDEGHGANAVNVLLVDIRAWDTFGEISVLVIVAVGIASLVFRTHTVHNLPRVTTPAPAASAIRAG